MPSRFKSFLKLFKQKKTKKQEHLETPKEDKKQVIDFKYKPKKKKKKVKKVIHKNKKSKHKLGRNYRTTPLRQQLKRRQGVHGL